MRLIDADDTIRIIKEYKTVDGEPLTERDKRIIEYVCDHIQYLQPTAYDVEAVVRELEDAADNFEEIWVRDAIEIVRGGRND